jgi:ComF family protein
MFSNIVRLAGDLVVLIYPSKCLICEGVQGSTHTPLLCEDCLAEIARQPLPSEHGVVFSQGDRQGRHEDLDVVFAGWHYDAAMQSIIHALKYRRRPSLSRLFGNMLAQRLHEHLHDEICQAVLVPVPLHRRRERERGFNQSLLLARALANAWGLSVLPRAIRRVRFTQSQATLAAAERWENVAGAFAPASDLHLDHHTIFLIDDVFTTGATMKACAEALKSAGAGRVIGVALAKAGQLV